MRPISTATEAFCIGLPMQEWHLDVTCERCSAIRPSAGSSLPGISNRRLCVYAGTIQQVRGVMQT